VTSTPAVEAPAAAASYVIATAGHIDHGKSTLVHALTGIDPDRLEEEKRRGMTIDLGFAYLDLPGGLRVGIVDVPGHRRFLKNMLAGVHAIDAVLFTIAADEGPMPQTREHLAIVDLLGIDHGVVALTKADLVDQEWLGVVMEEVGRLLDASTLKTASVVPVSGLTGTGLPELKEALRAALAEVQPRPDTGRPRMAIDRSFAMPGFGTVVTGTLTGGRVIVGDELVVLPRGRRVRVRGLQQHNRTVVEAQPGSRTAVNLVGVERQDVSRGDVLSRPGTVVPSRRLDVRLRVLDSAPQPLRHRAQLQLYHGAAEASIEVQLLDGDELRPGAEGWAQLFAAEPVTALNGDRFILRRPSPAVTVAGGVIVDVHPRRHRRHDPAVLAALEARLRKDPHTAVAIEIAKRPQGVSATDLALSLNLSTDEVGRAVDALVQEGLVVRVGSSLFGAAPFSALRERLVGLLAAYHDTHPLRAGVPREELRSRSGIAGPIFNELVSMLVADGALRELAGELALPSHQARPAAGEQAAIDAMLAELDRSPLSPPPLTDLMTRHHLSPAVIQYLVSEGRIVRVNEDTMFSRQAYDDAVGRLTEHLRREHKVTVAQARDLLHSTRRYVLPLLEWLDAQKVTRRVGDDRILRA
jgi:selenocysteine-specific elongation factor